MNDLAWIGPSVLLRRQALGLTQGALARLSGLSRATVNALERGSLGDLSVGRLDRLLQIVGLRLQWATPPAALGTVAAQRRALQTAAQTASVSYRQPLPARTLAAALASGELPTEFIAHMATLLDEAPLPIVVAAVEAAALQADVPAARVWKHIGAWAGALQSPRKEWHGL
jgi:transcriptional regulator with XRE-family HTH domain